MGKTAEQTIAKNLFPLVAKRIDSIPTLPLTLDRLLKATEAGDQSTLNAAHIVESDPALTAKVLRVINSPFYGLRFKISTLSHAIAMLGLPAVRNIAIGITPFPEEEETGAAIDRKRLWTHCLAVGTAARAIAREVRYDLPEEAYIGGLLHDLGRIVLDVYAPDDVAQVVAEFEDSGRPITELERKHLGMDHCQVGSMIAEQWNLPKMLKDAIQYHHETDDPLEKLPEKNREMVGIVSAADRLCWAFGLGSFGSGRVRMDELRLRDGTCLSPDQIDGILAEVWRELEQTAGHLGFEYGTDSEFLPRLREANAAAARRLTAVQSRPDVLQRMLAVSESTRRARTLHSVDRVIDTALHSVRDGLRLDRILLFEVDLDEEMLRGRRLFDDTHIEVEVEEINLPLNPEGVLGAVLREGAAKRVDNWATDGELLRYLGVLEVGVTPVIVNEQPRWLICADSFFNSGDIEDTDVALLDLLGTELGLAIENLVFSRKAAKLQSLALKDELTGLNNRRNLMKLIQKEIDRAKRYASPLSLVMVDIDHFKDFNDIYGHQAGDTILAEVAQQIAGASRDIDVTGRYGGEEFMVVLPETHVDQAIVYAERLRATTESFGKLSRKSYPRCNLTISLGVTSLLHDRDDIERLIHRVDHALYAAKERGRNRVCVD